MMISFHLRLRHRELGVYDQYVHMADWWQEYDSIEIIDEATGCIVARIEKGRISDLASRIEHLIALLEAREGATVP